MTGLAVASCVAALLALPGASAGISIIQMRQTDIVQFATGGVGQGEREDMLM